MKGFTIHGEHPENISPLVQAAFSIYKNHFGDLAQILVQIPNVDQAAIDQLNKGLQDAKVGEKKQRYAFSRSQNIRVVEIFEESIYSGCFMGWLFYPIEQIEMILGHD